MNAASIADEVLCADVLREVGRIAEACCDFDDCWCETAVLLVSDYFSSIGVEHTAYFAGRLDDGRDFGGCAVDWSHAYLVLADGTIVDPTIRQFRDAPRASAEQKRVVSGWPAHAEVANVAVIPRDHPFVRTMLYESHMTALGWIEVPPWFRIAQAS